MISNSVLDFLLKKKEQVYDCGGVSKIAKQHQKGKLTARERINVLLDDGSFEEIDTFVESRATKFDMDKKKVPTDGVVTGYGTILGKQVCVYSQDFTILGGSLGEMHAKKISKIQKFAIQNNLPMIAINDSGGARIQEGIHALAGYGDIFQNNINASGVIPQISLIMGPCAGGAAYSPALTDFTFMVKNTSYMFITGPDVIKATTNEDVSMDDLGGAETHSTESGVSDGFFENDIDMLLSVRKFMSFLPSNNFTKDNDISSHPEIERNSDEDNCLNTLVPENPMKSYNMQDLIDRIVDYGDFFEIKKNHAKNVIIGFGRLLGKTIGIVANQPLESAGCLDIKASRKAARFIRYCDAFSIPILSLIDVPGFLPGIDQEHEGIISHGAKLLYAYGEATVPKVSVVVRKAYGGSYIAMSSKSLGGDLNLCWPNAEIAVMGAKGAAEIIFKDQNSEDKDKKIAEFIKSSNWMSAASSGLIDEVVRPHNTKWRVARAFAILEKKNPETKFNKKHDNLPL